MTRILLALIALYKRWLSPAIHTLGVGGCRFQPTCSEYAMRAIAMHGPLRGSALAVWRVLRCNPFSRGGLDQVPPAHSVSHRDGASFQQAVAKNPSSPSQGGAEEQVVPLPDPRAFADKPLP